MRATALFDHSAKISRNSARSSLLAGTLAISIAAGFTVGPVMAQSSPSGFSPPTPAPSPTSAPQGPVDERAGVPIGPRVIRPARSTPSPSPTPTAAPTNAPTQAAPTQQQPQAGPATTTSAPATAPAQRPSPSSVPPSATASPVRDLSPSTTSSRSPSVGGNTPTPREPVSEDAFSQTRNAGASGAEIPLSDGISPGFESIPLDGEESGSVGPDDWYDVNRNGDRSSASDGLGDTGAPFAESDFGSIGAWNTTQNRLLLGIVVMALIGGTLAFLIWRRRRRENAAQSTPNEKLASGIRSSIANQMPTLLQDAPKRPKANVDPKSKNTPDKTEAPEVTAKTASQAPTDSTPPLTDPAEQESPLELTELSQPEAPSVEAAPPSPSKPTTPPAVTPPEPVYHPEDVINGDARLDLALEVVSASRSLMMFTMDFRLDIANRADSAVRQLVVSGRLACAQKGRGTGEVIAPGQALETVPRIGPQQSHRISGQLQLPLNEVQAMRQGSKPLFIPLLHVTLEGEGRRAISHSFVIGTPSTASTGRVHPLPLDGPPGSLPVLRAQLIRQPLSEKAPA